MNPYDIRYADPLSYRERRSDLLPPPAAPMGRSLGGGPAMPGNFTAPMGPSYGRGGNYLSLIHI